MCDYQHWISLYSAAVSGMKMHWICVKYYLVQECIALLFCDCSLHQPSLHIVEDTPALLNYNTPTSEVWYTHQPARHFNG